MTRTAATDAGRRGRVVVFDPVPYEWWSYDDLRELLSRAGAELVVPGSESEAFRALPGADVVVVYRSRLDRSAVGLLRRCKGVVACSVGMEILDLDALAEARIPARNIPDYCTGEVADHTITLLLVLWRRILPLAEIGKTPAWGRGETEARTVPRIAGRTLGIVGAGRTGRALAHRARSFGLRTIAHDPYATPSGPGDLPLVSLDELLARSDAVALCAPLTEETRSMINDQTLGRMRPGALLVNASRGAIIDEDALGRALRTRRLGGAALDVRTDEPPRERGDPLADAPNLIVTPHVAALSRESLEELHAKAAVAILDLLGPDELADPGGQA